MSHRKEASASETEPREVEVDPKLSTARAGSITEEREAARRFCRDLDEALSSPTLSDHTLSDQALSQELPSDSLMNTAKRLAEILSALGPVSPEFEARVLARVLSRDLGKRSTGLRWRAFAPVAAGLLAIIIWIGLTPSGNAAMASFAARFGLGQFDVRVTPRPEGGGESYVVATREVLRTLQDAAGLVDHALLVPEQLPDGYELQSVTAVSYENMPVWIPQPFYVELEYRSDAPGELHDLTLREFGLAVQEGEYTRRIREVGFSSKDVSAARDVSVGTIPGVLLSVEIDSSVAPLKRLIWQQGAVVVEMLSQTMIEEQMLELAANLVPME
jgi:hypothetical protein